MFCRIGIVVPLYSHVIKSTPIPPKTPKIMLTPFDPYLRTKPNYPLPKLTPRTTTKHPDSTPSLPYPTQLPYLTQTLINPTQINKYHLKHHTNTTLPHQILFQVHPSTNPNKTLLKLRIIPHTPKISTLI